MVSETFWAFEFFWIAAIERTLKLWHVALLHVILSIFELVILLARLTGEANFI
jgi:hypothetical protein